MTMQKKNKKCMNWQVFVEASFHFPYQFWVNVLFVIYDDSGGDFAD
jgi:hypothetical protein